MSKKIVENRYDFVIIYDVEKGNPNGDPDADNRPRQDVETGEGIVSDVCLKRKIRNYIDLTRSGQDGYNIYIRRGASLQSKCDECLDDLGIQKNAKGEYKLKEARSKKGADKARVDANIIDYMCSKYFDVRAFGAVFTSFQKMDKGVLCNNVTGPVQIGISGSIDPISPQMLALTRMAIQKDDEANDKTTEMGHKYYVPYGLYRAEGSVSAPLAVRTGFSENDLSLLWESIINMFENDQSAARGKMIVRELIVFKHESPYGNAPAHKLYDAVHIDHSETYDGIPRSYDDYVVTVDEMPEGVTCTRLV